MDEAKVKVLINDLMEYYKSYELTGQKNSHIAKLLKESADTLDELRSLVVRSLGFYQSEEDARAIHDICNNDAFKGLNELFERVRDPEWQKVHKQMGFMSPLADIYEELENG